MQPRLLLALAVVLGFSLSARAEVEESPLSLKEIGKLRLAKKTNEQIIELIKERGVDFEINKSTEGTLRAMRFKPEQIELIGKIAAGTYEEELKKEAEAKAKWEADQPKAPKAGEAPSGVFVGPRISDTAHDVIADRTQRIWKSSNTKTKVHQTETATVICSDKTASEHLPNLKKLEQELRKRFGEPIRTGTDKRSAVIVLLDNRYDYEAWVKTMFAIYEKDGLRWTGQDPLKMALKGPAFLTQWMTVVDMSALTPQQQKHEPVFCLGYLYMLQLSEMKAPDAMVNGMGNVCEAILFGQPTIRLNSYAMRDIGGNANEWAGIVRSRLKDEKLSTIDQVTRFSTASMEDEEYCEAWSLTAFLSQEPDLFNRLITSLRDGKNEKPLEVLLRVYGKSEEELTKAWHAFIRKG